MNYFIINNFQNALPSEFELCAHLSTDILHFIKSKHEFQNINKNAFILFFRNKITFFGIIQAVYRLSINSHKFYTGGYIDLKALSHYNVLANVRRRMKYISSTLAYAEI